MATPAAPTVRELTDAETGLAYRAMLELRPKLGSSEQFVDRINRIQRPEGYRLVGSFAAGDSEAAAVAGFRTSHCLAVGRALYCDDLSTQAKFRGAGHGGTLVDWMIDEARRLGCEYFHLDSNVGPERVAAHRLYLNKRMRISSYHFILPL